MIHSNRVQCTKCAEIIVSYIRNVKVFCECGDVMITGGKNVLMRSSLSGEWIELSMVSGDLSIKLYR